MAEWVKTHAANPEDLRLIFKTHKVEEGKKLLLTSTHMYWLVHMCVHSSKTNQFLNTHKRISKHNKFCSDNQ